MRAAFIPISLFLFFAIVPRISAAQITVKAEIDASSISVEDEASITVSVSGSLSSSDPVVPKVAGLDIVQTGRSSRVQIINGSVSTVSEFSLTVIPSQEGDFTIPPFSVFAGGVEYNSNPLKLSVRKGTYFSAPPPSTQNPFSQPLPPTQQPFVEGGAGDPFWITSTVTKTNPKISEQVLFRFKLYARQTADIVDLVLPEFADFLTEEVVPEKKSVEIINGQRYSTYEVIYALFPLKSGVVTIGETKLKLRYFVNGQGSSSLFDQFFNDPAFNRGSQTKNKLLTAPPIKLTVEELPQPVPQDFSNLVGQFGVSTELSDAQIAAGESATYTIRISGSGNIKDAILPETFLPGAKTYQDKPVTDVQKTESGIHGSKTFKMAIVPENAGELDIAEASLSYYDPETGKYESLKLEKKRLTVIPAEREETHTVLPNADSEPARVIYGDLAPLVGDAGLALASQRPMIGAPVLNVVIFAAPGLFLFFLILPILRPGQDRFKRRSHKKSQWHRVCKKIGQANVSEAELLDGLRGYFGLYTGLHGKALTPIEIEKLCLERAVSPENSREIRAVIERLEASRYGFDKAPMDHDVRKRLLAVFKNIGQRLND